TREDVATGIVLPDRAAGDRFEQRAVFGGRSLMEQLEERLRNDAVETQAMDITLDSHASQTYRMQPAVAGHQLRARRTVDQLLNQCGPLLPRNRVAAEQLGNHRLVRQLG